MYKDIDDNENDVVSTTTKAFPSHFMLRIENFSLFSERGFDKYESAEFEACGCKWRLIINTNGTNGDNVSVYISVADPSSIAINWEVSAKFGIYIHNQISSDFFCMRGKQNCSFNALSPPCGFSKFISKQKLTDPCNGYLVNDTCLFGAEVFVVKKPDIIERLSLTRVTKPYLRSWTIPGFSKLKNDWRSEDFTVADRSWIMRLCPRGSDGHNISIHLYLVKNDISGAVKANYTFRIKGQDLRSKHRVLTGTDWFGSCGFPEFMPITEMKDSKNYYLVNDCCILQVELTVLAVAHTSP